MLDKELNKISDCIQTCLGWDQAGLRRRFEQIKARKTKGLACEQDLQPLRTAINKSLAAVEQRRITLPNTTFAADLPVIHARDKIAATIDQHQVTILCGDTGSGKTTQLPKICLALGRGVKGFIGHTQPRRMAARSVARRIGEELKSASAVGFKVRFADTVSDKSYIKLMTDGILLAELRNDPLLAAYDTLIIDEAHERSLNIDFLLGFLKQLLPKRPDLKLIITSATIDPQRFSKHFDNAPIVLVEGRSYPVEYWYRPRQDADQGQGKEIPESILESIKELWSHGAGDVLVFFPGERDIRDSNDHLRKHLTDCEILPLYGRLSAAEQERIFKAHKKRRIVLATNVAETSLTVPGISCVIDTGTARISRYSVASKVQRLPIENISQASAQQRAGRCGRLGPGTCVRLYSQDDFDNRPEFTEPEVLRTNLAAVILQMASLRLGKIEDFPFMEAPEIRYINDGYRLLQELGAMDQNRHLTKLGTRIARLPVDPRLARILFEADKLHCLLECTIIVAILESQDPRERPLEHAKAADEAHASFADKHSDFIALLNLWRAYHENAALLSKNKLRRWCQQHFVSYLRMREWVDLHQQLGRYCKDVDLSENSNAANYENIHQALLSGYLTQVAERDENQYTGTRNRGMHLFPGSGIDKKPKWILAAEIAETSRVFARCVAYVEPQWIEIQAQHLLKKTYFDPRWNKKSGQVVAKEQASLYGLIVNPHKKVSYSKVDPQAARDIFIRDGLIPGALFPQLPFVKHNLKTVADIQMLEDKARRRDLLAETQLQFDFYNALIPNDVCDSTALRKWWKSISAETRKTLYMDADFLLQNSATDITGEQFPSHMDFGGVRLPLSYCFEPGHEEDGVSLIIPLALLNQVDQDSCDWLVPGMLVEKVTALLRGLPKQLRKNFVPVPDFANACVQAMERSSSLFAAISTHLQRMTGVECPAAELQTTAIPDHLRMRFKLTDEDGQTLAAGRNLKKLQSKWAQEAQQQLAATDDEFERNQIIDWDFGDLPAKKTIHRGNFSLTAYPSLVLEPNGVALRLLSSAEAADAAMPVGLRELIKLVLRKEMKYLQKNLPNFASIALKYISIGDADALRADLIDAVIEKTFIVHLDLPRSRASFDALVANNKDLLLTNANEISQQVEDIIDAAYEIQKSLKGSLPLSWVEAVKDIQDQLSQLIFPGFITATPATQRQHLPRYLTAIQRRFEVLDKAPDQDRHRRSQLEPLWYQYQKLAAQHTQSLSKQSDLQSLRWLLEELRVSIFAQSLGTATSVSVARVEKLIKQINN